LCPLTLEFFLPFQSFSLQVFQVTKVVKNSWMGKDIFCPVDSVKAAGATHLALGRNV
jgi:hypothetical protein